MKRHLISFGLWCAFAGSSLQHLTQEAWEDRFWFGVVGVAIGITGIGLSWSRLVKS